MQKVLLLLLLFSSLIFAIEFKNQEHSNYGDHKDNKEWVSFCFVCYGNDYSLFLPSILT